MSKQKKIDESSRGSDFIFHIQSQMDSMPKSYKHIANFILQNTEGISNLTITQLAKKTGTCSSTITRFCQSLGYSGYPQFKFNITQRSIISMSNQEVIEKGDSLPDVIQKLLARYKYNIDETVNSLDLQTLERTVNLITKANKIYFFSHGGSGASATLGQILLMQIGIPASSYTEVSLASMAAAQLKRGDVAIGISSSGSAKTAVDALRVARNHNATTIGITGFSTSRISYYSDILLCYNLGIEDVRLMHIGRMCEAAILGIIQNAIVLKNYDEMSKNLQTAKDAFMSARYV